MHQRSSKFKEFLTAKYFILTATNEFLSYLRNEKTVTMRLIFVHYLRS